MFNREIVAIRTSTGEDILVSMNELVADGVKFGAPEPEFRYVYRSTALKYLPLTPMPPIIHDGILPLATKLLLYGNEKLGKSFLAQQICECVSMGEPWLGVGTTKTRTLLMQFEIPLLLFRERIIRPNDNWFIGTVHNLKLDTKEGRKEINEIVENVRPGLVVLDPFYKILSGDLNDASLVQGVLDSIDDLVFKYGCAVIIVHHTNKMENIQGSRRLQQWPDTLVKLGGNPRKVDRSIEVEFGRHMVEGVEFGKLEFKNGVFSRLGISKRDMWKEMVKCGCDEESMRVAGLTKDMIKKFEKGL